MVERTGEKKTKTIAKPETTVEGKKKKKQFLAGGGGFCIGRAQYPRLLHVMTW
jgi:hypothetical protein